jgi:four helix bundle protein
VTNQLVRSATSAAANYRAACRARSKKEFVSKLGVVIEEADEMLFWLEMLVDLGDVHQAQVGHLMNEANELISIFVASKRTAEQSTIDHRQSTIGNQAAGTHHV